MREDRGKIGRGVLGEEEDHEHWQCEHGGDCHQQGPLRVVLGEKEPQAHRQCELARIPQEDQRVDVVEPLPREVEDGAGGGRLAPDGCTSWPTVQAARLGEYLSLNLATCQPIIVKSKYYSSHGFRLEQLIALQTWTSRSLAIHTSFNSDIAMLCLQNKIGSPTTHSHAKNSILT